MGVSFYGLVVVSSLSLVGRPSSSSLVPHLSNKKPSTDDDHNMTISMTTQ